MTSCIIPFYNEGERLFKVLDEVIKVSNLLEIIVVDDGSKDNEPLSLADKYPTIKLIKLNKNLGKAGAVYKGLLAAKSENILLLDADLTGINRSKIEDMVSYFNKLDIDMILLRYDEPWFIKIFGTDLSLSGVRILRKEDLLSVFEKLHPSGYQLEVAINRYMIKNKRQVFNIRSKGLHQTSKISKIGFFQGLVKEFKMAWSLIAYLGVFSFLSQLYFFGRRSLDS